MAQCERIRLPMQETQETWVQPLCCADPLEGEMVTCSSILARKIPWTEELVGYSPWGCKELDTTEHTRTHLHMCAVDP